MKMITKNQFNVNIFLGYFLLAMNCGMIFIYLVFQVMSLLCLTLCVSVCSFLFSYETADFLYTFLCFVCYACLSFYLFLVYVHKNVPGSTEFLLLWQESKSLIFSILFQCIYSFSFSLLCLYKTVQLCHYMEDKTLLKTERFHALQENNALHANVLCQSLHVSKSLQLKETQQPWLINKVSNLPVTPTFIPKTNTQIQKTYSSSVQQTLHSLTYSEDTDPLQCHISLPCDSLNITTLATTASNSSQTFTDIPTTHSKRILISSSDPYQCCMEPKSMYSNEIIHVSCF
jgi:hypothetical protein